MRVALWVGALVVPLAASGASEPTSGFLEVEGGKLWVEDAGHGPPLVLLHDGLLPSVSWDGQFQALAPYFHVVRYDRRRYGRSTSETEDFSQTADLAAVLDHFGFASAVIAGCSSGGGLAIDFTLEHPERVSALVLAGPVVSGLDFSEHFITRVLRNRKPLIVDGDPGGTLAACENDPYLTAGDAQARARLRALLDQYPFAATGGNASGRPPARLALPNLAEIHVPVFQVTGTQDIPDVHAHMGAIAAGIRQSRRQWIDGAGHLAHWEKPEVWNRLVLDFLAPPAWVEERLAGWRDVQPELEAFAPPADPPEVEIRAESRRVGPAKIGEHRVIDLAYRGTAGDQVPAWLVLPADAGAPAPAVLFLHHGQANRGVFLDEMLELADRGVAGLSIDADFNRPGYHEPEGLPWQWEAERRSIVETIGDLRRGLDLLEARSEIDRGRLAYVGYSLGATMGARLVGLEPRLRAAVLVAGFPALTRSTSEGSQPNAVAFREWLTPAQQKTYLDALRRLDGVLFLGRRGAMPLLLQFADKDEYISRLDAALFERAAGEPCEVDHRPGGHFDLMDAESRRRRRDFLATALGFKTEAP